MVQAAATASAPSALSLRRARPLYNPTTDATHGGRTAHGMALSGLPMPSPPEGLQPLPCLPTAPMWPWAGTVHYYIFSGLMGFTN